MDALSRGELSANEIEAINLHVSELNGCAYCVAAHGAIGKMGGLTADDLANYRRGIGKSAREDAILAFSRRIVRTGGAGAGTELAALREAGVSEGAVVEIIAHVALKALESRRANAHDGRMKRPSGLAVSVAPAPASAVASGARSTAPTPPAAALRGHDLPCFS